jgi:WD40 repeat protein
MVTVWDVKSGEQLRQHTFPGFCWSGQFVPDGRSLLLGIGNVCWLWNLDTDEKKQAFQTIYQALSLDLSRDGKTVAVGNYAKGETDNCIQLWEVSTGEELRRFPPNTGGIASVRFLPNSRYLISGTTDGIIQIWDCETGQSIAKTAGLGHLANSVEPLPDQKHALSFGGTYEGPNPNPMEGDNALRLWKLPTAVWLKEPDSSKSKAN